MIVPNTSQKFTYFEKLTIARQFVKWQKRADGKGKPAHQKVSEKLTELAYSDIYVYHKIDKVANLTYSFSCESIVSKSVFRKKNPLRFAVTLTSSGLCIRVKSSSLEKAVKSLFKLIFLETQNSFV